MKANIRLKAGYFDSSSNGGKPLISFGTSGHTNDYVDPTDWQFENNVICSIETAEEFLAELTTAIAEAKAARDAAKNGAETTTTEAA